MAEPDPDEKLWGDIAAKVAGLFGLVTGRSPTLTATINAGARHVNVDGQQVVFDTRALMLGMLAAGASDPGGVRYGNTAVWFRDWLAAQTGEDVIVDALSAPPSRSEVEMRILADGNVILSMSVKAIADSAQELSSQTVGRFEFEARHVLAAMIGKGAVTDQARMLFKLDLDAEKLENLKLYLVDRIMEAPEEGEVRVKWQAALNLSALVTPVDGITPFRSDSVRHGDDLLGTEEDVKALADLICLRQSTPLAVAIFGGWGSGKSTFMQALDAEIAEITERWAERAAAGETSPFITRIVQIRFNAWQFVDANLWASLTAEFFDQLRAGGWQRAGTARHAGLVEQVNSHVHSLTAEAAARRKATIESSRDVLKAQEERDEAAEAARKAKGATLGQAALDTLGAIYESQKANLTALGLATAGDDPGRAVDAIVDVVRSSRSLAQQIKAVVRVVGKYRAWPAIASILVMAAAGIWLLMSGRIEIDVAAMLAAVLAFGTLARQVIPALSMVRSIAGRGADIARAVEAADAAAVKTLLGKEVALRDATAEAEAIAQAAARADRALSRYIDPAGAANPPRLLRYILEDDPDTKSFEKEIGLIGRARRLFEAVDEIIRVESEKEPGQEADGEVPQRIILYIDDLDRCTEEQVYNVLQAIHLLLAFKSFAVIVGVDVKWIENALAREFTEEKAPALTEIERRQHAVHYLEKIFQVAFWLDPLSAEGLDGGNFARFVRGVAKPEPVPSPPPPAPPSESRTPADGGEARTTEKATDAQADNAAAGEVSGATPTPPRRRKEWNPTTDRAEAMLQSIDLYPAEIEFLASPEIAALAGPTPRAVTHLVNVYRLVRSRMLRDDVAPMGLGALLSPPYPLMALCVAIETGQPVEVADAFIEALKTSPLDHDLFGRLPQDDSSFEAPITAEFEAALASAFNEGAAPGVTIDWREKCPGLQAALGRASVLRGGDLVAEDVLRIARLARRFSFNRYR